MKLEAIGKFFTYRWPGGGCALSQANRSNFRQSEQPNSSSGQSGRIRQVVLKEPVVMEPASPTAKPIYWERANGEIWGPARPPFLAKMGTEPTASYWVIVIHEGLPVWIRSDFLRSKKQFEHQVKPRWSS